MSNETWPNSNGRVVAPLSPAIGVGSKRIDRRSNEGFEFFAYNSYEIEISNGTYIEDL